MWPSWRRTVPVYARMTIRQHLRMGVYLNEHWDGAMAEDRVEHLGLDPGQKAGSLSGGQRSQLALTLAVAKRPELLILDEPVASLDPLARREFLQGLMQIVAAHGVSVVLSSHVLVDLERVCDHLIVLADSQVQLAGDVDDLVATHHRLIGPRRDPRRGLPSDQDVVEESHTERQSTYLVHADGPILDPAVDGQTGRLGRHRPCLHEQSSRRSHCRQALPPVVFGGGRMIRFAWMQFRTNALVAGVGLIVLAIPVVITGAQLTHLYDTTVSNCATLHDCSAATSTFTDSNGFFGVVLTFLLVLAPALIGMFWGAPLVASEYESGTYRLAWTQGVTRRTWLGGSLCSVRRCPCLQSDC